MPERPFITPTVLAHLTRDISADVRRKLFSRPDVPWMKAKELDIVVELLARLAPARCLEWGAGGSTLYFPPRIPGLTRWLSIEHSREWADRVRSRNAVPQVEVVHLPPDIRHTAPGTDASVREDFQTYVTWPEAQAGRFDFILVDGRDRGPCLHAAFRLVEDRGVVVLHDANREFYFKHAPPFAYQERFTDWRTGQGGIWIGSKARPLDEILDVARHRRVWRGHEQVTQALFLR